MHQVAVCRSVMDHVTDHVTDHVGARVSLSYLQVEWDVKQSAREGSRTFDKDTVKGASPKIPQQMNYSDCGIYILQYVESFFKVTARLLLTVRRFFVLKSPKKS